MNAVIYARYSSDSQREESIDGQMRDCKAYCERNNINIVGSYIDRALSAKTDDRPQFLQMIRDSEKGKFDLVIVWKLDRFARNRYDSAKYRLLLKKSGVRLVSATENISEGPEGIILEAVLEGIAEYYIAELSEKVIRGQTENALKCQFNGGTIPLGYVISKDHKFEIDPETAPIVIEIFNRYDNGESMSEIVESFKIRGIKNKNGSLFTVNTVGNVLRNRRYIGEYKYREILIPKGIPCIIPDDVFDRVQERMARNRKAPAKGKAKEEYMLTTKLFCGTCNHMMVGESGKSRNGTVHYYYKCGSSKRHKGCNRKAVKKDWIEDIVVKTTVQKVLKDDVINRIADALVEMQEKGDSLIPSFKSQLEKCKKNIENLVDAIQAGIRSEATISRLNQLEEQRKELEISLAEAEIAKPLFTKEQIVLWISRFKGRDVNDKKFRKQLIDTFVNSVYVFDDKLVFTYNFKDGTETISLEDIEVAYGSNMDNCLPPTKKSLLSYDKRDFFE